MLLRFSTGVRYSGSDSGPLAIYTSDIAIVISGYQESLGFSWKSSMGDGFVAGAISVQFPSPHIPPSQTLKNLRVI